MAYRLDRQDYSSREIARMLDVSPTTAWRLVGRGEKLPPHVRDGVDLEVPELPRKAPLLPREKEGPSAKRWEGEGASVAGTLTRLRASPSGTLSQRERVYPPLS